MLHAAAMSMTGVTTADLGDRAQQTGPVVVALIIDQGPGPVERRRPDIIRVPGNHVTGRIADRAVDTLDPGVGGLAFWAVREPNCSKYSLLGQFIFY